jgi:site-specific DNA recombinase
MKEIVVVSGKGGTGKTVLSAGLAVLAQHKVIADCDVDAANLHLLLKPEFDHKENFFCGYEYYRQEAECTGCGKCCEVFRRVHWNNRGKKSIVWRCASRLENTGLFCDARTVSESQIGQVLVTAINQTLCEKDSFLTTLRDNIAAVISRESDKTMADIDKRLEELQTELLKLATSNADYEKVGDEIHRLRHQKQKLLLENANRDEFKKRMADMSAFLKKQSTALAEYDEQLVRRLIEKITVYEDKFTVEFKSGVTVDINE